MSNFIYDVDLHPNNHAAIGAQVPYISSKCPSLPIPKAIKAQGSRVAFHIVWIGTLSSLDVTDLGPDEKKFRLFTMLLH